MAANSELSQEFGIPISHITEQASHNKVRQSFPSIPQLKPLNRMFRTGSFPQQKQSLRKSPSKAESQSSVKCLIPRRSSSLVRSTWGLLERGLVSLLGFSPTWTPQRFKSFIWLFSLGCLGAGEEGSGGWERVCPYTDRHQIQVWVVS